MPFTLIPFAEPPCNWQVNKWSHAKGPFKVLQKPVLDETEHSENTKGLVCKVYRNEQKLSTN